LQNVTVADLATVVEWISPPWTIGLPDPRGRCRFGVSGRTRPPHPSVRSDAGHTEKIAPRVVSMQVACTPSVIVGLVAPVVLND